MNQAVVQLSWCSPGNFLAKKIQVLKMLSEEAISEISHHTTLCIRQGRRVLVYILKQEHLKLSLLSAAAESTNVNINSYECPGSLCGGAETHLLSSAVALVLHCFLCSFVSIMLLKQKKIFHCFSKSHSQQAWLRSRLAARTQHSTETLCYSFILGSRECHSSTAKVTATLVKRNCLKWSCGELAQNHNPGSNLLFSLGTFLKSVCVTVIRLRKKIACLAFLLYCLQMSFCKLPMHFYYSTAI